MSQTQLNLVIADIQKSLGSWGPDSSLEEMRVGWDGLFGDIEPTVGASSEPVDAGGVRAEWISAPGSAHDRAVLYLHGGGYVLGSINSHRDLCERLSRACGARALALDYRLAPEHPFPAAIEDATAAYRWLLDSGLEPGKLAVAGDSAGGGLTVATLVALRDAGVPLPGCATPLSPWSDLELTGESFISRADIDPMVRKYMLVHMAGIYVPDGDLRNPLVSPVHADLSGLPPLLIHVGEREVIHDDAARVADNARKAGVDVTFNVWAGQIHVHQIFASRLDEGQQAIDQLGDFIRKHTA